MRDEPPVGFDGPPDEGGVVVPGAGGGGGIGTDRVVVDTAGDDVAE
jgi:hypothetical protein